MERLDPHTLRRSEDGFVDEKIRPIVPGVQVVGSAITVRLPDGDLEALVPAVDLLRLHGVVVERLTGDAPAAVAVDVFQVDSARRAAAAISATLAFPSE